MSYSIVTLYPDRQYVGTLAPGWLGEIWTPSPFGSVADDLDSTYVEIEALSDTQIRSGLLSVDFSWDLANGTPAFMHMQMRAKNSAAFPPNSTTSRIMMLYLRADGADGGNPYDNWVDLAASGDQLDGLAGGNVVSPQWLNFAYAANDEPVDTANPSSDTWFSLNPDDGTTPARAYDALTNGGIRFALYVQASGGEPRHAYLDIYEVRMVLAFETAASTTRAPLLRKYPLDIGRKWPPSKAQQYGGRRVGGYQ